MKGYKAFKKGWVCRDFQYELGQTERMTFVRLQRGERNESNL